MKTDEEVYKEFLWYSGLKARMNRFWSTAQEFWASCVDIFEGSMIVQNNIFSVIIFPFILIYTPSL